MLLVVRNRVINKSALQIVENDFISYIDSIIYSIARGHFVNKTQLESAFVTKKIQGVPNTAAISFLLEDELEILLPEFIDHLLCLELQRD